MLQNSGSSWRDRVGAKSAIVAIHLLSVISSIRLCSCRSSRRGVECTCTPISSGCLESCLSMDCCVCIYGLLLMSGLPFASYILATVGRNCNGATRALPVCRFSPLLRHRGAATVDGGGAAAAPFNPSYAIFVDGQTGL